MSIDFVLPDLGEGVENSDIVIVAVLVSEDQQIEPGQAVVELETDKAVIEVPCPDGGKVTKVHVGKGDTVEVGQVLLTLETEQESATGEGRSARVEPPAVAAEPEAEAETDESRRDAWGPVRREQFSQIRRTIADRMILSAGTIPHVTNFDDADVTDLERFRKSVPGELREAGLKLTMMPPVMKAVATALGRHPPLNASLDEENDQIVYKQYVNLGVAVDTPRGLVVPVMRNVDRMSVVEIAQRLGLLAERARTARFEIEELRGGTFTVSNMGVIGGSYSTPIINFPEAAILLLGRARWMPVVRDRSIVTRLMLPLSLSYDHRLVDGAVAARFLNEVINHLQSQEKP